MNRNFIICLVAGVIFVAVLTTVLVLVLTNGEDELIVRTPTGSVKGAKIESDISNFNAFFSIPYAKAPVNELRFKTVEPIGPWEGIHDGTVEGPPCFQRRGSMESSVAARGRSSKRLGIFGFLNLNSEDVPGNMGLGDAIEALKWVQSNIASFGGDPDQVTIGGLSSGGIMVHALLLSPLAQGLFHKVIIHSGTALSYRFYTTDVEPSIQKTKDALDMTNSTNVELLDHLRTLDASALVNLHFDIGSLYPTGYATYHPYSISKDYYGIIPSDPLVLIQNNIYRHVPMLIGTTSAEGIRLEASMDRLEFVNNNFNMVVPLDLFPIDDMSVEKNETAQLIKEFYFGEGDLSADTFPEYVKLCSDSWYGHITDYVIRLLSYLQYNSSIYYYMFAVDGAYNYQKVQNNYTSPGVSHADDMGYMWKITDLNDIVANDSFSDLSRDRYVAMLSNFIISGNPTPEVTKLTPIVWESVAYPNVRYLLINETLSMQEEPLRERLLFWQWLYNVTEI